MNKQPAGYSGTPLVKKLGLKADHKAIVHNEPKNYLQLLGDVPDSVDFSDNHIRKSVDFMHLFYTSAQDLADSIDQFKTYLKIDGLMWVSWPKGSSKIATDLNREIVRDLVLRTGLVDIKVAAIDEDWSGLKFVYRKKDRR